jgi:hypothetical protein
VAEERVDRVLQPTEPSSSTIMIAITAQQLAAARLVMF